MSKKKPIGFNFFRPIIKQKNKDYYFSFKEVFEEIRIKYVKGRENKESGKDDDYKLVYVYNNEPARLADIDIDVETQYYHLVFERLDYQVPSRTTLHGDSKALDLDPDEYIGIDVSVLYDSVNHIFMIQRNRNSLGPTGIALFLNTMVQDLLEKVNASFDLAIVSDNSAKTRALKQKAYRKLNFKVTGNKAKGIIEKFTKKEGVGVDSVEIIFSSSLSKKAEIESDFVKEFLEEYVDDSDVKKLKIRAREDDESVIEPIDLIDHKMQTFCDFEIDNKRHLNPISVFEKMKIKYDTEEGGFKSKVLRVSEEVESFI
ncbi:DUF6731 family protein [Lysinibacillus sp. NPDC048646]|uniref:DUF6731 family protein n=1 Tax=Lysinibacillus sp. NPDC048646 TaxID=3390574 RepID=UPI003CFC8DC9